MSLNWTNTTERKPLATLKALSSALVLTTLAVAGTASAAPLDGGRIGYVMTERHWAVYGTDDAKQECPKGFNTGPREQYDERFPDNSDETLTEEETRLMLEGRRFHLTTEEEPFPFYEVEGPVSYGLNLDGKVDANDFRNPAGVEGVDNELYRAVGCIAIYRPPDGTFYHFDNLFMIGNAYNRWMIELTGVDSLENDDEVTVTFYRGLDDLVTDAAGTGFVSGGTQRVDARWGKSFIQEVQGEIVDGVLMTDPVDKAKFPWSFPGIGGGYHIMRDFRLSLNVSEKEAKGVLGGYVDVEHFSHRLNRNWTTHHHSYGQLSAPSLYRAMKRLADAHPDPETGENTAISSAVDVTLTQVYIVHPKEMVSN